MKIKRSKRAFKKKIFIATLAAALIVASIGIYVYAFKGNIFGWSPLNTGASSDSSINYDSPTDEQKSAGDAIKQGALDDAGKPANQGSDEPIAPVSQDNGKSRVDLTITHASSSQIGTLIGAITNSGTCTLTMTKGATTITRTSGVQALANSSTCKNFDIPTSEISSGTWSIVVHFENEKLQADAKEVRSL